MNAENRFKKCCVDGCERNAHRDDNGKRGYCSMHYSRVRAHGSPDVVKPVPRPAQEWIAAHADYGGDDCLTWPFHRGKDGYGRVHHPADNHLMTASRLMCVVAHGEPPTPKHEAAHTCGKGNCGCVNPNHLYWATPTQNQNDRAKHGTSNRGERQWKAKLTTEDVRTIRVLVASGHTQKSVAAMYGLDQSTVSEIKTGRKWGWLD